MNEAKEFQGKTLDEAIREACDYFGVAREKLEIEIVSDAKTGIFGLVGAKKAVVRAGRAATPGVDELMGGETSSENGRAARSGKKNPHKPARGKAGEPAPAGADAGKQAARRSSAPGNGGERAPDSGELAKAGAPRPRPERDLPDGAAAESFQEASREDPPEYDLETCDRERLFAVTREAVLRLVRPIVGEMPCEVSIAGSRVRAALDCGDAAGLLVGRDGQTLASIQYLAARIIARQVGGAVRLRVDAGKYRERRDDELKELALSLAGRVKETGRAMSTRPLTAYQRRIVHLTLEPDALVHTCSEGEGAQRKVVISLKSDAGNADPAGAACGREAEGLCAPERAPSGKGGRKRPGRREEARDPEPSTLPAE